MLMRQETVNIAIQGDGGVLVTEDIREGFDIHAALEGTGGEGMPQGVKAAMRDAETLQKERKTVLIGTHREGTFGGVFLFPVYDPRCAGFFLLLTQKRQDLSGDRDDAAGGGSLRRFGDATELSVLLRVMATFIDGEFGFLKVDVLPFQSEELADTQSRIEGEDDAEHLGAAVGECRMLDPLLLLRGKTADLFFRLSRASDAIGGVGRYVPAAARRLQGALCDGDDRVHG